QDYPAVLTIWLSARSMILNLLVGRLLLPKQRVLLVASAGVGHAHSSIDNFDCTEPSAFSIREPRVGEQHALSIVGMFEQNLLLGNGRVPEYDAAEAKLFEDGLNGFTRGSSLGPLVPCLGSHLERAHPERA